jgi:putative ATP-binding cassette transporter
MAKVAEWRASVERVLGLVNALNDLEKKNKDETQQRIRLVKSEESVLGFNQVCIAKLNGEMIIACIEDQVKQGEHVLISGNGATAAKLFKAIAGLWPWGKGTIYLPDDEPMYFMPPRPYLPRGTLRSAICYPYPVSAFNQTDLEQAFDAAGLNDLLEQLDHVDQWEKTLSREQMQRLGLVRLLLVKPKWILVQEAFDSLDPEGEADMLRLITERLPDASLLTIMNQPTADAFHERRLTL